jgi:hypothetical protein
VEKRSVRRHLAELERARLITRQERRGKQSLLVIEDPSAEETDLYLRALDGSGEDRIVLPTQDKIVRPYKKEEELEERQNLVNAEDSRSGAQEGEVEVLDHISRTISRIQPNIHGSRSPRNAKHEYLAQEMVDVLRDEHSLGFYRKIAARCPPQAIFEALSAVKQAARDGTIRKSRGALFTALVKESSTPRHE